VRESFGMVIPDSYLLREDTQTGVLHIVDGEVIYDEITILDRDGDLVLVSGLGNLADLVTNPNKSMIGLRVR